MGYRQRSLNYRNYVWGGQPQAAAATAAFAVNKVSVGGALSLHTGE